MPRLPFSPRWVKFHVRLIEEEIFFFFSKEQSCFVHIPPLSLFFHDESWRKLVRASFFSHNIFSLSQKAQCLSPILIPILKRTAHLLSLTFEKERALKLEDRMEEKRRDKAFFRRPSFLLKNSRRRKCFSRLDLSYPQNRCEELQSKDCCFHECPPLLGPLLQKL